MDISWIGRGDSPSLTARSPNMSLHAPKVAICLWYDHTAEEAAKFYAKTFPASSVGAIQRAPADYPGGKRGDALVVEFTVLGIPCIGLNGGPTIQHNKAFSFQVTTTDQAETDRYWDAIVKYGGRESQCGWCKDKWGVAWQITPIALTDGLADSDPAARARVFEAMMKMTKLDIAAIVAARKGTA
jgi:2-polyprenyl-6-hydroxyphenyl methylase/3-demethylubiquinone-9 3-methyltransferase